MTLSTQPYKGTRDFYPEDYRIQRFIFERMASAAERFGYERYDGPMLEPFELYAAKTGEEIVNQQLYWLVDKGERKLAVRPEMTPTLARMVATKVMELPRPIRWYSIPNLWRYERPQRGRLREHWQLNVDVLGGDRVLADAELMELTFHLMSEFGGEKYCEIRVNHRGLMDEFFSKKLGLNQDQALKVVRAIDAQSKIGDEKYATWLSEIGLEKSAITTLEEFFSWSWSDLKKKLPCPGVEELDRLFSVLKGSGVEKLVRFDARIMRGLDYYTGSVFEMYDTSPENTRAMFGGGRYDNLIGLFGKNKLSGVGFGMGDVTLRAFLEVHGLMPKLTSGIDVLVTIPSEAMVGIASDIARRLRKIGRSTITPLEVGKFSDHLKLASRIGARFAILLGEKEVQAGNVLVKDLASEKQSEVKLSDLEKQFSS